MKFIDNITCMMYNLATVASLYSPNGRFLVQETFPKTLPWFVLILISLQRWQHRVPNETKHSVSPHLIGPQLHPHDLASKQRWLDNHNQHESAVEWSISRGLLGAATCGELSELTETDAERSTGVLLLSAAESSFTAAFVSYLYLYLCHIYTCVFGIRNYRVLIRVSLCVCMCVCPFAR